MLKYDDVLSRFDSIPKRDIQTDGRMDRQTDIIAMLKRDKNS